MNCDCDTFINEFSWSKAPAIMKVECLKTNIHIFWNEHWIENQITCILGCFCYLSIRAKSLNTADWLIPYLWNRYNNSCPAPYNVVLMLEWDKERFWKLESFSMVVGSSFLDLTRHTRLTRVAWRVQKEIVHFQGTVRDAALSTRWVLTDLILLSRAIF